MLHKVTFRSVENSDLPLLALWLSKDYILKWYHDASAWLDEITARHSSFSWIHHYIVMADDVAIGFCQYYDCFDAQSLEDWYHVERRDEMFSIDYMIGDECYLGKGYGKQIVQLLTNMIKTIQSEAQIIVQPELENIASVHVLLANGYVFDPEKDYFFKQ